MEEKMDKKEEKVELIQTPTQVAISYKVPGIETELTLEQLLVWMGNQILELKKNIA